MSANQIMPYPIRCRVRLDYRGAVRPPRFIFGGTEAETVAREQREQWLSWWKNVPHDGVEVEEIEEGEIYILQVEDEDEPVAFAPLEISLRAYSPEDLLPIVKSPSFRRLEILQPVQFDLSHREMERLLTRLFAG